MTDLKAAQQQFREQYKVAESTAQHALNVGFDLIATTVETSFNAAEQNLHQAFELRGQADRIAQEALTIYRTAYQNGLHNLRDYVRKLGNIPPA